MGEAKSDWIQRKRSRMKTGRSGLFVYRECSKCSKKILYNQGYRIVNRRPEHNNCETEKK